MHCARRLAWLAALALTSCYSTSIGQTPSTVPQGKTRWGLGMGVQGTRSGSAGIAPELSLQHGLFDRLDFGLKTNLHAIEGQLKVQLVRGDFDLSLAAAGALSRDPDNDKVIDESEATFDYMRSGRVMLIAGQRVADSLDLVLMGHGLYGLRSGQESPSAPSWHAHFAAVGGGFGLLFKGTSQFLPEVVVTQIVDGVNPMLSALQLGDTLVQFTVTGMFGGAEETSQHP